MGIPPRGTPCASLSPPHCCRFPRGSSWTAGPSLGAAVPARFPPWSELTEWLAPSGVSPGHQVLPHCPSPLVKQN